MSSAEPVTPVLDALTVAVYEHVLRCGRRDENAVVASTGATPEEVDAAYWTLERLHVIEQHGANGQDWRAVHPELASASLVAPMETASRRLAATAERLREQIRSLEPVHSAYRYAIAERIMEYVAQPQAVGRLIDAEADRCTDEVLTLQPGGGQPVERLAEARNRDLGLLRRSVRLRTIYQHGARYDLPTAGHVDTLAAAGGEFRTVDEIPGRLLIFDRKICFIPVRRAEGVTAESDEAQGIGLGALVIRQPSLVAFLVKMFWTFWDQGQPLRPNDPQPHAISEQLKLAILRLMATGAKDEVIARRLGLSVRTCRRRISVLMEELGVSSRFQAGVEARTLNLVGATVGVRSENVHHVH